MALTPSQWIYIIIESLIILFSVVSNAVVIYCVVRFRKLRSITNVLICNLAVSDILLAGFVMPQKLHDISHEEDFYEGNILCKIVNFCPIFVITSSIYTLVCVSFERKRAIVETNNSQMTFQLLYKIIPALWLFGLVISIPTLVEYAVNKIVIDLGNNTTKIQLSCGSQHMSATFSVINAVFVAMVSYVIPVILMFKNYLEVALFVWKKGKQINTSGSGGARMNGESFQIFKSRVKIVKLLIVVAVIFAASWMPFFVTLLYAKITNNDASDDASGFVNLFLILLASFSCAYNTILYVVYNPGFRRAFQQLTKCLRKSRLAPNSAVKFSLRSERGQEVSVINQAPPTVTADGAF